MNPAPSARFTPCSLLAAISLLSTNLFPLVTLTSPLDSLNKHPLSGPSLCQVLSGMLGELSSGWTRVGEADAVGQDLRRTPSQVWCL